MDKLDSAQQHYDNLTPEDMERPARKDRPEPDQDDEGLSDAEYQRALKNDPYGTEYYTG
jgi:hypothetical protein